MRCKANFAGLPVLALLLLSAFPEPTPAQPKMKGKPPLASLPCPKTDMLFTHPPTDLGSLSAIVPLGNLNPASHTLPTRHAYIYPLMKVPGDPATAITVPVLAPGDLELVVVEFDADAPDWALHLKPCRDVTLYFRHIDKLDPKIAAAVGDMKDGGVQLPDFVAKSVSIQVAAGQLLGHARNFDIGLHDFRKPPQPFVNPARYAIDFPALVAKFPEFGKNPAAKAIANVIVPQALFNRCPLDYLTPKPKAALEALLADYDGNPLASGKPPCHSHMQDVPGTAQGNWFRDLAPDHDALFAEERALALANWNVDPTVQLFSLNENLPGFTSALLQAPAQPDDVNSAFEFPVREGPQRTNRRFAEIKDDAIYCYDLVRIHRGGLRLEAVILLAVSDGRGGPRSRLTIEVVKTSRCPALKEPWAFSRNAATYYR